MEILEIMKTKECMSKVWYHFYSDFLCIPEKPFKYEGTLCVYVEYFHNGEKNRHLIDFRVFKLNCIFIGVL